MARPLLLEIGMEEMPARFVRAAAEQLGGKLEQWLAESRISYSSLRLFATPRRIAVLAYDVGERQADLDEEVRGPARKIALDADGNWTKAALGFMRGQGAAQEDVFFKDAGGVEYVFAKKSSKGSATAELLPAVLGPLIASMSFPKNMKWGARELKFARPIRWMVALYGGDVIPFELAGVASDRVSRGHRFLGQDVSIASAEQYEERLAGESVIADIDKRKSLIVQQLGELAAERGWDIAIRDDLLEEVLFLVEYPTALFGSFDPAFLHIPEQVLITSMREHQRYFPVRDGDGKLLPHFVTVRNGNSVALGQVSKGNEKVLRARLSDADFFYKEDQKMTIASALERLETIVFHEELGTIADKVRRVRSLAAHICALAGVTDSQTVASVDRAAEICKFDLVSQMVYEFPELQGIMGEDYARKLGEPEAVAVAVNEHYKPRFAGDSVPSTIVGAVVSLADKLDTLAGCLAIGIVPTGSQDPYALRRQAAGIVHIIVEFNLPVSLSALFRAALDIHHAFKPRERSVEETIAGLRDFIALRVKNMLSDKVRYDIADAVMGAGIEHIPAVIGKAVALSAFLERREAKETIEALNRVANLAAKAQGDVVDDAALQQDAEIALYNKLKQIHILYKEKLESGDAEQALQALADLRESIRGFFDSVMVMTDDEKLRLARLALLAGIAGLSNQFADFSKIVWQN